MSRSSARAVTRARRRVASAPTPRRPRRPVAASTRGHVTGRSWISHLRASVPCAWDSERPEYASWTTRTPPKPRSRDRRARASAVARASAARRDRVVTSRIDEANGARDATRRDATRRDARARTRTIEGARARPRAGRRGGVRDGTTRDEDVALSDVGDRARRSGRAMASRATPWGSRRARMMGKKFARRVTPRRGRTRARGREDARAMGRRGHRHGDIAIERAVGVRRRANESRRGGVATRTRGATNGALGASNGRAAWATTRGRRRSRARGVDKPPARASRGSGLGRDSSSATNSVESTARSAETDRTRARVFRVVYSRSLASPLPRSPPRRSKPSPVASRAKPPPRRLARRPSRR